jgi:hypothetical protein
VHREQQEYIESEFHRLHYITLKNRYKIYMTKDKMAHGVTFMDDYFWSSISDRTCAASSFRSV